MAKRGGNDRIQMIGSEADTTKNSPLDMRQSAFAGGMVEMVGSEAEMPHRTTPLGDFSGAYAKNVRGGQLEMIGSETEMNRRPERGWESYPTPISENTDTPDSNISGFPGGRR